MRVPDILTDLATKIIQRRQLNPYTPHQNFSFLAFNRFSPEDARIKKHDGLIDKPFQVAVALRCVVVLVHNPHNYEQYHLANLDLNCTYKPLRVKYF